MYSPNVYRVGDPWKYPRGFGRGELHIIRTEPRPGRCRAIVNGVVVEDVPIDEKYPMPRQMTFDEVCEMEQFNGMV